MESMKIAACFLSAISLLLLIVALASDYWVVISYRKIHSGLWRACVDNDCESIGMQVLSYMHATRAFLLMGMTAGAVLVFGLCASFYHTHIGSISIKHLTMWASFGAGVCSLIAMSTFTGVIMDNSIMGVEIPFGWSFAVGWASVPLFFITGGLTYKAVSDTT